MSVMQIEPSYGCTSLVLYSIRYAFELWRPAFDCYSIITVQSERTVSFLALLWNIYTLLHVQYSCIDGQQPLPCANTECR